MKWKTTLGMALAGAMLTAPAWTHHAAQGIISDDIWNRIDEQVSDMHQEIFEEAMGSMRVDEAPTMQRAGERTVIHEVEVARDGLSSVRRNSAVDRNSGLKTSVAIVQE